MRLAPLLIFDKCFSYQPNNHVSYVYVSIYLVINFLSYVYNVYRLFIHQLKQDCSGACLMVRACCLLNQCMGSIYWINTYFLIARTTKLKKYKINNYKLLIRKLEAQISYMLLAKTTTIWMEKPINQLKLPRQGDKSKYISFVDFFT